MEKTKNLQDAFLTRARAERDARDAVSDERLPAARRAAGLRQLHRRHRLRRQAAAHLQARHLHHRARAPHSAGAGRRARRYISRARSSWRPDRGGRCSCARRPRPGCSRRSVTTALRRGGGSAGARPGRSRHARGQRPQCRGAYAPAGGRRLPRCCRRGESASPPAARSSPPRPGRRGGPGCRRCATARPAAAPQGAWPMRAPRWQPLWTLRSWPGRSPRCIPRAAGAIPCCARRRARCGSASPTASRG